MKKILLITDNKKCWAWSYRAMQLQKNITNCEFDLLPANEFRGTDLSHYDLIYFSGYSHIAMTTEEAKNLPIPFISTCATGGKRLKNRLTGELRTGLNAIALIVQNDRAKKMAKKMGFKNVIIIPNGIDSELFSPTMKECHSVGIAGNLSNGRADLKGSQFTYSVAKELDLSYTTAQNLDRTELAKWYKTLKYYIQPSHSEGCANTVMEAMSSGLPVFIVKGVGYHGQNCIDIFNDNKKGNVIFIKRDTMDILEKIKKLTPKLLDMVGKNARKFAMKHTWKKATDKHEKLFDAVPEREKINKVKVGFKKIGFVLIIPKSDFVFNKKTYKTDKRYMVSIDILEENSERLTIEKKVTRNE